MFGYVRPADGHLTAEDKSRFQAAYCGLCRSLGRRYGLTARMILNYDLAFLAMLLSREPECLTAHCRCPAHPIRGCDALEGQDAFDTAADLSVILTWWQLKDGVADHGFFRGLPVPRGPAPAAAGLSQGAGQAGPASMRTPRRTWRSWHGWRRSNAPL